MNLHESGQMYLESIYILSMKQPCVRSIDVGEYLGYSKPSVSRAMTALKKGGYVDAAGDGSLRLTQAGLEVAREMYTRHTVLSGLLMRLGVDEETATQDACRMEHVISEASFAAIRRHAEAAGGALPGKPGQEDG